MKLSRQTAEHEYKYLNDLTLARIRDVNFFWMTSMVLLVGVCALADKLGEWYIVVPGMLTLLPMCLAISWNLEAITRARTYIGSVLEPQLGGSWEKMWTNHPLLNKKKIFAPEIIPLVFIVMYLIMMSYMVLIAFSHWQYNVYMFIALFASLGFPAVYGFYILYSSFSRATWRKYSAGWAQCSNKECAYKI